MAVYVFGEPGMLLVKVGYSGRPAALDEREMSLKRFWRGGEMLYVHEGGSQLAERVAHRLLRPRFWLEREWFMCGADAAVAAVREAVRIKDRDRKRAMRRSAAKRKQMTAVRLTQTGERGQG